MSTFINVSAGDVIVSGPDVYAEVPAGGTVTVPDAADAAMESQPQLWEKSTAAPTVDAAPAADAPTDAADAA